MENISNAINSRLPTMEALTAAIAPAIRLDDMWFYAGPVREVVESIYARLVNVSVACSVAALEAVCASLPAGHRYAAGGRHAIALCDGVRGGSLFYLPAVEHTPAVVLVSYLMGKVREALELDRKLTALAQALAYVAATLPAPSQTVPGRLAYYALPVKRLLDDKRTPIKVRRYLSKPLLAAVLCEEEQEELAVKLDAVLADFAWLEARIELVGNETSGDFRLWEQAYSTERIRSCMQASNDEYGVARHETWRCYLTAYNNRTESAPGYDNGARLVVLWNRDKSEIVSRSIVVVPTADNGLSSDDFADEELGYRVAGHSGEGGRGFYGDHSISAYLDKYYPARDSYHEGFLLTALPFEEDVLHPYLDGEQVCADLLPPTEAFLSEECQEAFLAKGGALSPTSHYMWCVREGGVRSLDCTDGAYDVCEVLDQMPLAGIGCPRMDFCSGCVDEK